MQVALDSLRVSRATGADLWELAQIWSELMSLHEGRDEHFALAPDGLQRWMQMAEEMLDRDDAFLFKAEHQGRLVGFCLGWVAHNPPIYRAQEVGFVSEVAVVQSQRRRGVGSALIGEARRWFRERGLREFQLSTAVWNEEARRFWEAVGGEPLLVRYRFDA